MCYPGSRQAGRGPVHACSLLMNSWQEATSWDPLNFRPCHNPESDLEFEKIYLMTLMLSAMWRNYRPFPSILLKFSLRRAWPYSASFAYSEICWNWSRSTGMTTDQEKYVTGFGEDALSRQILKHKLEACSGASSVRKNLKFQLTKDTGYVRVLL